LKVNKERNRLEGVVQEVVVFGRWLNQAKTIGGQFLSNIFADSKILVGCKAESRAEKSC
jgi:hypothetical protein